jgi:hypothetical protein
LLGFGGGAGGTIAGANGCSLATTAARVTLPAPTAQPQPVGSTDVSSTGTVPTPASAYIGSSANNGQARVLVYTQPWSAPGPTPFSTWGNPVRLAAVSRGAAVEISRLAKGSR